MITCKKPEVSLKAKYAKIIRLSLIISLLLLTTVLMAVPRMKQKKTKVEQPNVQIENVEIPETQQYEKPPAPSRPTVPVASENEDIADDVTIDETTFQEFEAAEAPPPAPEEGPSMKFVAYDERPELIGGMQALKRLIEYPEIAREAGVDGTVTVRAFINKHGDVEDVVIIKGLPKTGLNEAAIEAVLQSKWKPAKQRDRAVGVWYAFPIRFSLKTN